eukprot:INCI549.2.p1 GENE.INCI549.2~~INCI549.2.p1  ORF type:complete len:426 (+),score=75.58 INCI549.2:217-1494(+)
MSCLRGAPSPAHKEEEEEDEGEWTKEGTDETSRKVWAPSHWPNEAKSLATQEARFRKERAAARLARETRERRQRRREVAEALVAKERTRDDVAANLKQRVREFREVRYQQAEDARALGADQRGFALLQKPRTRWGEVEAPKGHTAGGARPHYDERVDFRTVSSLPAIPVKGIDYTKASIVEMMQLVAVKHQDPAKHTAAMQHLGRLMAGNFNIDHRVDGYNMRTVMMEAAYYRNHAACAALLHRKADPNARGKFGRTALHIAAVNFSSATTKALLEARADPTITDKFKRTALDVARAKFVPENNRLLLIEKQKTEAIVQAELKRLQEASVASDTTATEERQASPQLRSFLYNEPVLLPHLLGPLVEARYFDLNSIELMEPEDLLKDVRGITRAEVRKIFRNMPKEVRLEASAIVSAESKKKQAAV